MLVTLLSFAKITEVTMFSPSIQKFGMSPVFVEPTWLPEELKALEVVMMGGGGGVLGILKVVFFLIIRLILIILQVLYDCDICIALES
jgi:hypothetical protein